MAEKRVHLVRVSREVHTDDWLYIMASGADEIRKALGGCAHYSDEPCGTAEARALSETVDARLDRTEHRPVSGVFYSADYITDEISEDEIAGCDLIEI